MSNHFSADNLKFPGDDRRLDLTDVAIQPERVHERPGQALITIWRNATSSNVPCREVPEKVTNRGISRSNIVTILSL